MTRSIDKDKFRYLDIVKGKVREELKKAVKKGELIGKKHGRLVKVPIPHIDLPRIRYGNQGQEGVGQGEGEKGDVLADPNQEGEGQQQAGDQEGDHLYEYFSIEELAKEIGEDLELPNIKPKGKKMIYSITDKLKTINRVGPRGRLHKKRTYKNALRRSMANGEFDPFQPLIPVRPDRRFKSFKEEFIPERNAVIFYMMDISGSMGTEQKEIVRLMNFWIDVWLSVQYKGIESRYIVHEARAWEVTRDDFYHTSESGGTMISTAFQKCSEILQADYDMNDWNVYIFYSSDGDNWSSGDTEKTFGIMDKDLLPYVNMIGYAQVKSQWGSGQFLGDLRNHYSVDKEDSSILTTTMESKEDIMKAIKDLLGKGK
ncbi:MAG: DUF444 family protein [Candidatus Woesearchaeota archaeon]